MVPISKRDSVARLYAVDLVNGRDHAHALVFAEWEAVLDGVKAGEFDEFAARRLAH